ncbi:MAG: phosphatase PAP2 family protein [Elusimicrobiota bacterium]
MDKGKRSLLIDTGIPLLLLLGVTLIFRLTDADLAIQKLFYLPAAGTVEWGIGEKPFWRIVYHYGNYPGLFLALAAVIVLIAGYWKKQAERYRKMALFLLIVIMLGPGIIVNGIFKDHWGRPRPRQIKEFGGRYEFLPVWTKGEAGKGKSFPCGHCSMGFYFLVPFFFLRKKKFSLSVGVLALGTGYGTLMGIGRIIQGAHFASDVIWAGGMVYLTGAGIFYAMRMDRDIYWTGRKDINTTKKTVITGIISLLAAGVIAGVLLATPYYKETTFLPGNRVEVETMKELFIEIEEADIDVDYGDMFSVDRLTRGFGLPGSSQKRVWSTEETETGLVGRFSLLMKGWFTEFNSSLAVIIPDREDLVTRFTLRKSSLIIPVDNAPQGSTLKIKLEKGRIVLNITENSGFTVKYSGVELVDKTGMEFNKTPGTVISGAGINIDVSGEGIIEILKRKIPE